MIGDHDRQIALQYTRFKGFSAADLFDMEALVSWTPQSHL